MKLNSTIAVFAILLICSCEQTTREESKVQILDKLSQKQEQLDMEIAKLRATSRSVTNDAKYQLEQTIDKMERERNKIKRLTRKMKRASDKELKALKSEIEDTYDAAEKTLHSLVKELD